jgi:hypothetical protein
MSDCFDLTIIDQLRAELARVTAELQKCSDLCATEDGGGAVADVLARKFARVTSERDENYFRAASLVWVVPPDALAGDVRKWSEEYAQGWKDIQAESASIRARVADLDAKNMVMRGTVEAVVAQRQQAEQRVAELEAALRDAAAGLRNCMDMLDELDGLDWGEDGMPFTIDWDYLKPLLARAESATPAKHCEDCAPEFGCWDGGESCYKQPLQSSTPAKHPDTVREWMTGTPDVPVGAMRRLWCAVLADNGKIYHSVLCYANGHAMQLADWAGEIPDCCKLIPGDEDNLAWCGWYEESCDHCETQWHSSANVIAWMELPKFDAAMKGGAHD